MRQPGACPGKATLGGFQHAAARVGQSVGLREGALQPFDPRLRVEGFGRPEQHARHHARG